MEKYEGKKKEGNKRTEEIMEREIEARDEITKKYLASEFIETSLTDDGMALQFI
jgi:hypothetical protein